MGEELIWALTDLNNLKNESKGFYAGDREGYIKFNNGLYIQWGLHKTSVVKGENYSRGTFKKMFSRVPTVFCSLANYPDGTEIGVLHQEQMYFTLKIHSQQKYDDFNVWWIAFGI